MSVWVVVAFVENAAELAGVKKIADYSVKSGKTQVIHIRM